MPVIHDKIKYMQQIVQLVIKDGCTEQDKHACFDNINI